jgi:hypothetical protein
MRRGVAVLIQSERGLRETVVPLCVYNGQSEYKEENVWKMI